MQIPTIHLNGTSKDQLLSELHDANTKLYAAIQAVIQCTPNLRDYYVQSDSSAFLQATKEHEARVAQLVGVREEVDELIESIEDQAS